MKPRKFIVGVSAHLGLIPWLTFLLGLSCTLVACLIVRRITLQRDHTKFVTEAKNLEKSIRDTIIRETDLGRSVSAFLGAQPEVTKSQFNSFLTRIHWSVSNSAIGAVSYVVRVRPNELPAFFKAAFKGGVPKLDVEPVVKRNGGDLLLYREPNLPGMKPLGTNLDSLPSRLKILENAIATGLPASTGVTTLYQDRFNPRPAVVLAFPVFTSTEIPKKLADRKRLHQGFVMLAVRLADSIRPLLAGGDPSPNPAVSLYSGSLPTQDALVFSNVSLNHESSFSYSQSYSDVTGDWTMVFKSTGRYVGAGEDFSWPLFAGGLLFSVALFALTALITTSHKRVERYVDEIEQRGAGERLLSQTGALLTGSGDVDTALADIAKAAIPDFCDSCTVDVVRSEKIIELVSTPDDQSVETDRAKHRPRIPPEFSDQGGVGKALRTGVAEFIPNVDSNFLASSGLDDAQAHWILERGVKSQVVVPIYALNLPFAALTFQMFDGERRFSLSDRRLVEEVAQRIGLAIENRKLFVGAEEEIAQRQVAQEALKTLNEGLEELVAERTRELQIAVEELEAFCYSVSHDLRAPLRSVDGFSKALLDDYETKIDEDGIDYLRRIRAAAKKMDLLITSMLTLSRLSRAEISREMVDLSAVAQEIIEEASREFIFESSIQSGMEANVDPHMVQILFENLISNAAKFSSKQPRPRVGVGCDDGVFFVKDNGAGFDPLYSNKLFQPFERLHSASEFPGTGIGLATVYRVVKRHGGDIWAESKPGAGATFFFTLSPPQS